MGKWIIGGGYLTFSPWRPGTDDPNLPPPEMESKPGPPYASSDGHTYETFLVKVEIRLGNSPFGHLVNAGADSNEVVATVWQEIVNWSKPIN